MPTRTSAVASSKGREAAPAVMHLTTAHVAFDNRIFVRECRSLARAGYVVTLLAPHARDEVVDGVTVRALPRRSRAGRLLLSGWTAFRAALKEHADVYHFHDPDLLPWMALLRRLRRRPVIYDVHEDYLTALAEKPYLPRWAGRVVGQLYRGLERRLARPLEVVIAERYYARWFPTATPVLNYPEDDVVRRLLAVPRKRAEPGPIRLLYTGRVAVARGALQMAALAARLPPGGSLTAIGACAPKVAAAMRALCPDPDRLRIQGEGGLVPFSRIVEAYGEPWTAALALFPESAHVREKELTKFFEYMAAGLPIVGSDFPVWRALIVGRGAGVCVDPVDDAAVLAAVLAVSEDDEHRRAMGAAGRKAVRAGLSWETQEERLLELYARLAPLPRAEPVAAAARGR